MTSCLSLSNEWESIVLRTGFWVVLFACVGLAGCQRPAAESKKGSTEKVAPQEKLAPDGDLVGTPVGLSGPRQIVAASDFAIPKTAGELVAQMLRAIQQEDHDAFNKLYYQVGTSKGYADLTPQEQREAVERTVFSVNKMGLDKDRWGIKRLVLKPITKSLPKRLLEQTVDGVLWVRLPNITHEIKVQYDWKMYDLQPPISSRLSGWWIGEKDGSWFICTNQRASAEDK